MLNLKKNYQINDLVMFYNTHDHDLQNTKCSKCLGFGRVEYLDNGVLKSKDCSCYFGFVSSKDKKDFSSPKISFGFIIGVRLYEGKNEYVVNTDLRYHGNKSKEIKQYYSFFKDKYEYFDFPIDSHSLTVYTVLEEEIINSCSKFRDDKLIFEIPEFNYIYNVNDIVYFSSETYVPKNCELCKNTKSILDINGNKMNCPNSHYGHNEYTIHEGLINKIYLEVTSKNLEYPDYKEFDIKYKIEVYKTIDKVKKEGCGYIFTPDSNYLSKNLDEMIMLVDSRNEEKNEKRSA